MSYKILITPRSFGKGSDEPFKLLEDRDFNVVLNPYKRILTEKELLDLIASYDAIIVGLDHISKKVIEKAVKLKVISKHGIGVDNIDVNAAKKNNIIVTNTPGVNAVSVAELTVGLIISLLRDIPMNNYYFKRKIKKKFLGNELFNKTLGIIGLGNIGTEVAKRSSCFGMRIIYTDIFRNADKEKEINIKYVSIKELLQESDIISLHLPLNERTKYLIDKKEICLMKKGVFLINTARSDLINEKALFDVLKQGRIRSAAFDVIDQESPLLELENVICLNHIGAYTYESIKRMGIISVKNVIKALEGKEPLFKVV